MEAWRGCPGSLGMWPAPEDPGTALHGPRFGCEKLETSRWPLTRVSARPPVASPGLSFPPLALWTRGVPVRLWAPRSGMRRGVLGEKQGDPGCWARTRPISAHRRARADRRSVARPTHLF